MYQSGAKKGETGVSLKGRLLRLGFIKIDGETVYQAQADETETSPEAVEESVA